mmetsp:Transcript_20908/g.45985  ORF Transcript_20908/g.45985 Transcript_20908/m.45985 type:complete len:90 (+) Transcript_20908:265-534(+)
MALDMALDMVRMLRMLRMLRMVRMVEGSVTGHSPQDSQREPHAVVAQASLAQANWDSQAMLGAWMRHLPSAPQSQQSLDFLARAWLAAR